MVSANYTFVLYMDVFLVCFITQMADGFVRKNMSMWEGATRVILSVPVQEPIRTQNTTSPVLEVAELIIQGTYVVHVYFK